MNRKIKYLILVICLVLTLIIGGGCGSDDLASADTDTDTVTETIEDTTSIENTSGSLDDASEEADAGSNSGIKYDQSAFLAKLPEWNGQPYCEINNNKPDFSENEIWKVTQESLDPLDSLGRCGTANSCIGQDGMPTQPRGNISEVHPTGWHSDSYDDVEGGKLYNRCHLIAHKLSGDDAVPRNLITGTSYMNRQGMLPFEDEIYEYVKGTGNHVMYRVTPCFKGDDLVARGVHMQAISVEDSGEGLAFNVFCYNVQPGIEIDYSTGDNRRSSSPDYDQESYDRNDQDDTNNFAAGEEDESSPVMKYVLNTSSKKFHHEWCNSVDQMKDKNKKEIEATRDEIMADGYKPCGNCHP